MSLAYLGESFALSEIVGCDAFLEALDDQALRVRILENDPRNPEDALNLASRLEALGIMGSTGPSADKVQSRFYVLQPEEVRKLLFLASQRCLKRS